MKHTYGLHTTSTCPTTLAHSQSHATVPVPDTMKNKPKTNETTVAECFVYFHKTLLRVPRSAGAHDPCVVPRAVPVVEALAAMVLADFYLLNKTRKV